MHADLIPIITIGNKINSKRTRLLVS